MFQWLPSICVLLTPERMPLIALSTARVLWNLELLLLEPQTHFLNKQFSIELATSWKSEVITNQYCLFFLAKQEDLVHTLKVGSLNMQKH